MKAIGIDKIKNPYEVEKYPLCSNEVARLHKAWEEGFEAGKQFKKALSNSEGEVK